MTDNIFSTLQQLQQKPELFSRYTRLKLWNDPHMAQGILQAHLDPDTDLASRNHAFIERSLAWITEHFAIRPGSKVIDFGCGPGLYTLPLARAGAEVTGVDFSDNSIGYARQRAQQAGLDIRYINQNYLEFETDGQFDLITMIWCDFSALSPAQRHTLLLKFAAMLADGGRVLLDVDSMVRFEQATEQPAQYQYLPGAGFYAPQAHHVFTSEWKYQPEKVLLRRETVFSADEQFELYHWAQCFTLDSLQQEFERAGLTITEHYSDVAGSAGDDSSQVLAVVAEKR